MNQKVKITKVIRDDKGDVIYDILTDDSGKETRGNPAVEDVVGEIVHWGKKAFTTDDNTIAYETVIYMRREDDGTIEEVLPSEVVYLDRPKYTGVADDPSNSWY